MLWSHGLWHPSKTAATPVLSFERLPDLVKGQGWLAPDSAAVLRAHHLLSVAEHTHATSNLRKRRNQNARKHTRRAFVKAQNKYSVLHQA